jgi:hypothetical protein
MQKAVPLSGTFCKHSAVYNRSDSHTEQFCSHLGVSIVKDAHAESSE